MTCLAPIKILRMALNILSISVHVEQLEYLFVNHELDDLPHHNTSNCDTPGTLALENQKETHVVV